jgi:outer membrane lipoprotein-sorting protein
MYIDEANLVICKAITTTKENGTYEIEMSYGKYSNYGLPDKVVFGFNTKDYKMPKGVTLEFEDEDKATRDKMKNKKGKVEIIYKNYTINKGIDDNVFKK